MVGAGQLRTERRIADGFLGEAVQVLERTLRHELPGPGFDPGSCLMALSLEQEEPASFRTSANRRSARCRWTSAM